MIFSGRSTPNNFKVLFLEDLTSKERRRTPNTCCDMGNIRIDMTTMDYASVQDVLASLPEGSFWDDKQEKFLKMKVKDYQPPVRIPFIPPKVESPVSSGVKLPPPLPKTYPTKGKPYFLGL